MGARIPGTTQISTRFDMSRFSASAQKYLPEVVVARGVVAQFELKQFSLFVWNCHEEGKVNEIAWSVLMTCIPSENESAGESFSVDVLNLISESNDSSPCVVSTVGVT